MQDLWYIGKAIGLPEFNDLNDRELEEMAKALRRAKREDTKALKGIDEEQQQAQVHRYIEGEVQPERTEVQMQFTAATWMRKIREKYKGSVIRRTVNSLDYTNTPISRLDAYEQHRCVIALYEHEYEALEGLAAEVMDSEVFAKRFASEVRSPMFGELRGKRTNWVRGNVEFLLGHPKNPAAPVVCQPP